SIVTGDGSGGIARATGEEFAAKAAAFIDLKEIDGNVLGAEAQGLFDGGSPTRGGLIGQARDEIETDVGESRGSQVRDRGENIFAAMHAARGFQFGVVEGLRAEADAVDADGEPGGGFFGRDGFGIGFEGDFRAGRTGTGGK